MKINSTALLGSFKTCLGSLNKKQPKVQEVKKQTTGRPRKGPQWVSRDKRIREEEADSGRAVRKASEGEKSSEQSTGEEMQEISRLGWRMVHVVSGG